MGAADDDSAWSWIDRTFNARRQTMGLTRLLLALGLGATATACSDAAAPVQRIAAPDGPSLGAEPHLATPVVLNSFLNAVVDPATGVAYDGGGRLRLTLARQRSAELGASFVPPGPCRSSLLPAVQDGFTLLGVCALIDNPGGARLVGGALVSTGDAVRTIVPIGSPGLFPPGPCRSYVVRGALLIGRDVAAALWRNREGLAALFEFQEVNETPGGALRATFGPSSGGPDDPGAISGFQEVNEVDPGCVIDVTLPPRS
jgi:hypothetical protein